MKNVNIFKFIANASEELTRYEAAILKAETYDSVKQHGNRMIGFIDCMVTLSNGMICMENNEITAMIDDVEQEWYAKTFQAMADRADELNVDSETVVKLLRLRDQHRI